MPGNGMPSVLSGLAGEGDRGGAMSITRIEILHRAATQWPLNTVPYSQTNSHPDASGRNWRCDCSGFVSMCLNLTEGMVGGRTTVGLVTDGFVHRIRKRDLRPGDLVGHLGGGTGRGFRARRLVPPLGAAGPLGVCGL